MRAIFFSTYPIDVPRHGGQIRTVALVDALRTAGWAVENLAVYDSTGYQVPELTAWHFPYDSKVGSDLAQLSKRSDVDICDHLFADEGQFVRIRNQVASFEPTVLVANQPWLWPVLKKLIKELNLPAKVVYSSHNCESQLISALTEGLPANFGERIIDKTLKIERDLLRSADGVIAVSEADLALLLPHTTATTIVAPNGVSRPAAITESSLWSICYKRKKVALFVGSAHPPNAWGFEEMIERPPITLAPDQRIVVVGGVANLLPSTKLFTQRPGLAETRVDLLGSLDSDGLNVLIRLSKVILLPIKAGGGTNLKTAEAIFSGKPIIGTSAAFRGYEKYVTFSNVFLEDDSDRFVAKIGDLLSDKFEAAKRTPVEDAACEELLWPFQLKGVADFFRQEVLDVVSGVVLDQALNSTELGKLGVFGWHDPEVVSNSFWSKNLVACLALPFHVRDVPLRIEFFFTVFDPTGTGVELGVSSGQRLLGKLNVSPAERSLVTVLEQSDFYPDGSLELFFSVSRLSSPSAFGYDDLRQLGVNLQSVRVSRKSLQRPDARVEVPAQDVGDAGALQQGQNDTGTKRLSDWLKETKAKIRGGGMTIDTVDGKVVGTTKDILVADAEFRAAIVRGWASTKPPRTSIKNLEVILRGQKVVAVKDIRVERRADVAEHFGAGDLEDAGFAFSVPAGLPPGKYVIEFYGSVKSGKRLVDSSYSLQIS